MQASDLRSLLARVAVIGGGAGMIVGAIDPMEGSIIVLAGSLLFAIGTAFGPEERRVVGYRFLMAALVAIGVAAMWGFSSVGGFGGSTGRSMWWGLLVLPYPIGWSLGIWGPHSPRWLLVAGAVAGAWYLALFALMASRAGSQAGAGSLMPAALVAVIGAATIAGCIFRARHESSRRT